MTQDTEKQLKVELVSTVVIAGQKIKLFAEITDKSQLSSDKSITFKGSDKLNIELREFIYHLVEEFKSHVHLPELDNLQKNIPASFKLQEVDVSYRSGNSPYLSLAGKCAFLEEGKKESVIDLFVAKFSDESGVPHFVFGLTINADIDLPQVPLFGDLLHGIDLKPLVICYASALIDPVKNKDIKQFILNPHAPDKAPSLDPKIGEGLSLLVTFNDGDSHEPLVLPLLTSKEAVQSTTTHSLAVNEAVALATAEPSGQTASSDTIWIQLQKTLGPLHFKQIGLQWRDQRVGLLLDASLELSILTIALNGFGVNFPLSWPPNLTVELDGLAISYHSGPANVSGGFLHVKNEQSEQYIGEALIALESWAFGALGAFGQIKDKDNKDIQASLFIFGALSGELGTIPPVVFKGLAGGFGYNRALKIPAVDQVSSFPLVKYSDPAAKSGPPQDPMVVLKEVNEDIPIKIGEYWLAAGVHFSAFELIEAFALLTVEFGVEFEIALLGIAGLAVPSDVDEHLAEAEMAIDVSYVPATGLLSVAAQLTPSSFILSPDCHLTGGFAFRSWFSGKHAGDFVVTFGGYNAKFKKPDYYPSEALVGYNWKVSDLLSLKGGMYFALTPQSLMAGGHLDANFNLDVDIVVAKLSVEASLHASVDFLMNWKPFHYDAIFQVSFSGSFTVHALVSFSLSFQAGADLHLYGPPFAGSATFKVYGHAITIPFGDSSDQEKHPIEWNDFEQSFLPSSKTKSDPDSKTPEVITTRVGKGLIKDLTQDNNNSGFVVNPHSLTLKVQTAIPVKQASFNSQELSQKSWQQEFGVSPVGVEAKDFHSKCVIAITYEGSEISSDRNHFTVNPILSNSPKALWGDETPSMDGSDALVKNTVVGFEITLSQPNALPDQLPPIDLAQLRDTSANHEHKFDWSHPTPVAKSNFSDNKPSSRIQKIKSTIATDSINQKRQKILGALVKQNLNFDPKIDVNDIANPVRKDAFLAAPVLSLLGESK